MSTPRKSPSKPAAAKKSPAGKQAKAKKAAPKPKAKAKVKAPVAKAPAPKTSKPAAKPRTATKAKAEPVAKAPSKKKPATKPSAKEKTLRAELAGLDAGIAAAFDLTERVRLKGQRAEVQRRIDTLAPGYAGPQVVPTHRRPEAA